MTTARKETLENGFDKGFREWFKEERRRGSFS